MHRWGRAGAAALAIAATAAPAAADEVDDQAETIVVTGLRDRMDPEVGALGAVRIEDAPVSLTVFDREAIDRVQARSLGELLRGEPGVTSAVNAGSYANNVEIRGFQVGSLTEGLPNEAGDFTYRQDALFNVGQVTVLRGVSSLLYGGATFLPIGGAVDVALKAPLDRPFARLTAGFADRAMGLLAVDVSRRFGPADGLGVRVNLGSERGHGPIDRQRDQNNTTIAANFDARLGADLDLAGGFEHADNTTSGYRDILAVAPGLAVPRAPRGRTNVSQPWARYPAESDFGWARLDWRPAPGWSLRVKGIAGRSYRGYVSTFATVTDANGDATIFPGAYDNRSRNEAGEATLRGEFATGAVRHRVTLAGNWARERWYFRTNFEDTGVATDPIPTNIYDPVRVPRPMITGLVRRETPAFQDTGYGVAALYSVEIGPVTLLGGARRVWLEGETFYDPADPRAVTASYDDAKTTPIVTGVLKLGERLIFYASFAEGLELGGLAPLGTVNAQQRLPVRATKQYETGLKWTPRPELLIAADVFEIERPLEFIDFSEFPQGEFVQSGRQRHRGAEVTIAGTVTPTTHLSGGVLYLDAAQRRTGDPLTEGNRPSGVPEWRVTFTGEQAVGGGVSLVATVEHQAAVFLDIGNTQRVPDWTRLDIGAAWRTTIGGRPSVLRATVDNVTGERYWAGAQFGALTYGVPERTWRVSLAMDF